jgi:quercetin dioxygenase-like cupin family protein
MSPVLTHWHEPTGGKRAGFGKFGRPKTPYDNFMESEGIPVFRDIGVSKVQNLPLAPWKRTGGRGSYIQLHGTEGKWGCYVVEVPGAGALNAERHIYEEIYYVVEGRGSTEVWLDGDNKRHVFEWQKGSLFSIPVNAWHRIVNASSAPALLLAGTTAPNVINLINNVGAVFDNPYQFRDRFSGADDFYKYKDDIEPDPVRGLAMRRTNFVPDIVNCDLPLDNRRSPGFRRVEPFMTGNTFYLWIGQHENGRYSKAHAHTSAAVLICIKGKGYTYSWPERDGVNPWQDGKTDNIKRVDYEPVGMVSAAPGGARWFHQHFGASKEPLRLTAWFGPHNPGREPGPPGEQHIDYTAMDIPEGGSAIPYWMEDPFISVECEAKLRPRAYQSRMEPDVLQEGHRGAEIRGRVRATLPRSAQCPEETSILLIRATATFRHRMDDLVVAYAGETPVHRGQAMAMTKPKAAASSFSTGRSLVDEDEIVVLSVGVDIGSSTSHLCSRASCWSGLTAATSCPSARPSTPPTSCSRPIPPRRRSTPKRSAPSSARSTPTPRSSRRRSTPAR